MAENAVGCPYPITKNPLGFLAPQKGVDQIKSDLLIILLTNPGERVMMPTYGTPLRKYLFDPNDPSTSTGARNAIINSIKMWEPRIKVNSLTVTNGIDPSLLNPNDTGTQADHVLSINLKFSDPGNIQNVQDLRLEIPMQGS